MPTFFGKIFGFDNLNVSAQGSACGGCDTSTQKFDVVVVLDRSYSMCLDSNDQYNNCYDLDQAKQGIQALLNFFNPATDRLGLAVLSSGDNVSPFNHTGTYPCDTANLSDLGGGHGPFYGSLGDFMDGTPASHDSWLIAPLSNTFKNADGSINNNSTFVSDLNCLQPKFWTPMAPAVQAATNELITNGRPDARKIIIYMGDGGGKRAADEARRERKRDRRRELVHAHSRQQPATLPRRCGPGGDREAERHRGLHDWLRHQRGQCRLLLRQQPAAQLVQHRGWNRRALDAPADGDRRQPLLREADAGRGLLDLPVDRAPDHERRDKDHVVRRRLLGERGVAIVEFAIIFPVLLLLLLGTIQVGIYIYTLVDVRQATREGGRVLTTLRNDSNGLQTVENKVAASVGGEVDKTKLSYTFSSQPPWAPGTTVTMTVTYPAALNVMGIDISDGPIKATAKVTVE